MWGQRWNLVVHDYLKSCVFKPARSLGIGALPAQLLTFLASGLLHEYTFSVHCSTAYVFGQVILFFVAMGGLMFVESLAIKYKLVPQPLKSAFAALPSPVVSTMLALISCVPFDPLFMKPWRDSGMLMGMAKLVVVVRCS